MIYSLTLEKTPSSGSFNKPNIQSSLNKYNLHIRYYLRYDQLAVNNYTIIIT